MSTSHNRKGITSTWTVTNLGVGRSKNWAFFADISNEWLIRSEKSFDLITIFLSLLYCNYEFWGNITFIKSLQVMHLLPPINVERWFLFSRHLNVCKNQETAIEDYFCQMKRRKTDITTRLFVANNYETFLLPGSNYQQISYKTVEKNPSNSNIQPQKKQWRWYQVNV